MKLTQDDKLILKEFGYEEKDFPQLERAVNSRITKYEYSKGHGYEPITRERAIELLGRKKWLAGISRSAFHWSATQLIDDSNKFENVLFDSSRLFR